MEVIEFMFSNLKIKAEKLEYDLNKPFDLMVNKATYQEWLSAWISLLTFSTGFESLLYKVLPVGFLFRDFSTEQAVITFYEKSIPDF